MPLSFGRPLVSWAADYTYITVFRGHLELLEQKLFTYVLKQAVSVLMKATELKSNVVV
jgi:hypothetical protein